MMALLSLSSVLSCSRWDRLALSSELLVPAIEIAVQSWWGLVAYRIVFPARISRVMLCGKYAADDVLYNWDRLKCMPSSCNFGEASLLAQSISTVAVCICFTLRMYALFRSLHHVSTSSVLLCTRYDAKRACLWLAWLDDVGKLFNLPKLRGCFVCVKNSR